MIKTFRGLIASGEVDTIRLGTNDGLMGYRVLKFEVIQEQPGIQDTESTVTLSKATFTPGNAINFNNPLLLGVAYFSGTGSSSYPQVQNHVVFDQEVFNQDIFVGTYDTSGKSMNYYLELEQVKLDLNEATIATLKDMRGRE